MFFFSDYVIDFCEFRLQPLLGFFIFDKLWSIRVPPYNPEVSGNVIRTIYCACGYIDYQLSIIATRSLYLRNKNQFEPRVLKCLWLYNFIRARRVCRELRVQNVETKFLSKRVRGG